MSSEAKREELREKIEAGERRNEERSFTEIASDARDSATQFVKENPLKTIAGGVAVGLIIGAIMNRGRIARGASRFGSYASELGTAYALSMMDAARSGQDRLEDFGDSVSTKALRAKRGASYQAAIANDATRSATRRAARKATRGLRDIRRRVTT